MPTDLDYAYLAGLVDGEGCITIGRCVRTSKVLKRKSYAYNIAFGIGMTQKEALQWVHKKFGGTFYARKKVSLRGTHVWFLQFNETDGIPILKSIRPYLRLKGPQTRIVLEYHRNKKPATGKQRYYGVPMAEYEKRKRYWLLVKSYNAKERFKASVEKDYPAK